jgi:tetratricopeptide (TPR) repeat protein
MIVPKNIIAQPANSQGRIAMNKRIVIPCLLMGISVSLFADSSSIIFRPKMEALATTIAYEPRNGFLAAYQGNAWLNDKYCRDVILIWKIPEPKYLYLLKGGLKEFGLIRFSPDGSLLTYRVDYDAFTFRLSDQKRLRKQHVEYAMWPDECASFSAGFINDDSYDASKNAAVFKTRDEKYEILYDSLSQFGPLVIIRNRETHDTIDTINTKKLFGFNMTADGKYVIAYSSTDDFVVIDIQKAIDNFFGRRQQKIVALESTAQGRPDDPAAQQRLAEAYQHAGKFHEAAEVYTKALRLKPSAKLYAGRGSCSILLNDFAAAITDLSQAITMDPSFARAYFLRAVALDGSGKSAEAAADYAKAIAMNPRDIDAHLNRSACYFAAGNLDSAIADCSAAIAIDRKRAKPHVFRGYCYLVRNELDNAISDYDTAIALDPDDGASWYNRGLVRAKKGDNTGAGEDFNAAYDRKVTMSSETFTLIGYARYSRGDYEKAGYFFDQATTLKPDNDQAWFLWGMVAMDNKEYVSAASRFNNAKLYHPDKPIYGEYAKRCLDLQADADLARLNYMSGSWMNAISFSGIALGIAEGVNATGATSTPGDYQKESDANFYREQKRIWYDYFNPDKPNPYEKH